MSNNHPPLWNMPVSKDDGIDPHCRTCGKPFEGKRTDEYCPHCLQIKQWLEDHWEELEAETNDFADIPPEDMEGQ